MSSSGRKNLRATADAAAVRSSVEGLYVLPEFISTDEESALVETVAPRGGGRLQHFGSRFDFRTLPGSPPEGALLAATGELPPIEGVLLAVAARIGAMDPDAVGATALSTPNQVSVNEYFPGAIRPWFCAMYAVFDAWFPLPSPAGQGVAAYWETHSSFDDVICYLSLSSGAVHACVPCVMSGDYLFSCALCCCTSRRDVRVLTGRSETWHLRSCPRPVGDLRARAVLLEARSTTKEAR